MNGEATDDFWYNPAYESSTAGSACYGREGCRQAYLYVLHGGRDVAKAKEIAATYCVYHASQCADEAKEVARGKVIEGITNEVFLAYLGGARGMEDDGTPCNSFAPGTDVLLADGTTKPIQDVKTGDKVLATDPKTGRTTVKTVTAEITGKGLKHLVRITLSIEVDGKKLTASVTATDAHPFWVPDLGAWVDATNLASYSRCTQMMAEKLLSGTSLTWTISSSAHPVHCPNSVMKRRASRMAMEPGSTRGWLG